MATHFDGSWGLDSIVMCLGLLMLHELWTELSSDSLWIISFTDQGDFYYSGSMWSTKT